MRNLGQFFDNKHFARGFHRSGDFTINEANLLENYGKVMQGLYDGTIQPEDDDEREFLHELKVEQGELSKYALCWKKYLNKIQRKKKFTLCSSLEVSESSYDESDSDDF